MAEIIGGFAKMAPGNWSDKTISVRGNPVFVMRLAAGDADRINPFLELSRLPQHLRATSLAGLPDSSGGVVLLAFADPARGAEEFLDHACRIGRTFEVKSRTS